ITFSLVDRTNFKKKEICICPGVSRLYHLECLIQHTCISCNLSSKLNIWLFNCLLDIF
uniref:Uncharacterized protein n=1 Tax=Macaca fascicularis TaxID=9541 RepID=A0A7N9D3E1_MACFA